MHFSKSYHPLSILGSVVLMSTSCIKFPPLLRNIRDDGAGSQLHAAADDGSGITGAASEYNLPQVTTANDICDDHDDSRMDGQFAIFLGWVTILPISFSI